MVEPRVQFRRQQKLGLVFVTRGGKLTSNTSTSSAWLNARNSTDVGSISVFAQENSSLLSPLRNVSTRVSLTIVRSAEL